MLVILVILNYYILFEALHIVHIFLKWLSWYNSTYVYNIRRLWTVVFHKVGSNAGPTHMEIASSSFLRESPLNCSLIYNFLLLSEVSNSSLPSLPSWCIASNVLWVHDCNSANSHCLWKMLQNQCIHLVGGSAYVNGNHTRLKVGAERDERWPEDTLLSKTPALAKLLPCLSIIWFCPVPIC